MRGYPGLLALLCFAAVAGAQQPRLVVLTYNIQIGTGTDGKIDLERTAAVIRSAAPDVVSLQEVDRKARRTNGTDQAVELARLTGMHMIFGKASVREGIDLDGGEYGVAILSRFPVLRSVNRPLPFTRGFELRTVLEAVLDWRPSPGKAIPLRLFATHFDNASATDRATSARMLVDLAKSDPDAPSILAGDLNALPESEPLRILGAQWQSASAGRVLPTFRADAPRRQIDYVLFSPAKRWRVVEARVPDESLASDHRPLLAVIELLNEY